ncbi:hypothetical protein MAM1_0358d10004 [Mucor ambiguus]|uniref:RRM domain-containing protein n=1 Tax=Mucor ambiguus TaxID=91626 RepID=A0A0C9N748_9FUNG|nr:hypothetical protein MAM1_0358d10004 [Mucor ambiguus]
MLPEDELDFEDFGDLGDIEGPELTNEELEALEQELRMENASLSTEQEEGKTITEKATPTVTTTTEVSTTIKPAAAETQKENQDTVNNTLEEGETPNDSPAAPSKPSESQHRSSNQQHQHQPTLNNYNNYKNNGFYGHQPSMPMNNMFPQYPPFSNRIYVNPKFNKNGASQQMQLQQEQQRKFMELEAHRMLLMQRQMQLQQQQQQQEQQRLAELDQKRREAAENMKRKREQRNAETGEKRMRSDETNNHSEDRAAKRLERFAQSPAGGISIKGVAAARHNGNLAPRNIPYQPPNERKVSVERRVSTPYDRKPSITSRLGKPGNPPTPAPPAKVAFTSNKNSSASITATPVLPIVTNGKSNTLIITGLGKDAKLQDIRNMANGAHDVKLDSNANSATVVFPNVESAVTFRRKYNRYQMGESHINISFQK